MMPVTGCEKDATKILMMKRLFARRRRSSAHLRAADQYRIAVIWRGEVTNGIRSDGNMKMN
jgi:hypothetical protein